ncbi:hypothetical protein QAD02_023998 [Eretmocerus hayati]|uniref:Uncharacterized protein n=1 Tax=Eretmocerus hayati TaxID=131215 RepID=A0ACC2PYJ7_9HYME|nr:hypothetical protein QAD02_023998 [Eretmocerus hayati]
MEVGRLIDRSPIFEWILDNSCIESCKKVGDRVSSPLIRNESVDGAELKWRLYFYPRGRVEDQSNNVPVMLMSNNQGKVEMKMEIAIVQNGVPLHYYDFGKKKDIFHHSGWERGERYLKKNLIMNEATGLLINDNLTVQCHFILPTFEPDQTKNNQPASIVKEEALNRSRPESVEEQIYPWISRLAGESRREDILEKLMEDEDFGDVKFKVNGRIFRAHEALVASQSPVLAKIISDSKAKQRNFVVIDDTDDRVFREMMRCIYFNRVEKIESYARTLLSAAMKFSMNSLKILCEKTISKSVNSENAMQYLKLADVLGLNDLRKQIIDFIVTNSSNMMDDPSFKMMKEMKSSTMFELIEAMAAKMKPES